MGFLESTLDEGQTYRTFIFKQGEEEIRLQIQFEDLVAIFSGMRPRNLDAEHTKRIRELLAKELKRYRRVTLIHTSKVRNDVWNEYKKELGINKKQRGHTYVKDTE
jgi:hypothetical protein